jgi:hypothetical protein
MCDFEGTHFLREAGYTMDIFWVRGSVSPQFAEWGMKS